MVKILLVDDEEDIVYLLKKILMKAGYETVGAYSGREALEKIEEQDFDLVILDIMMPDISGWNVSRTIKKKTKSRKIPVVMLTVRTSLDSVEKSLTYAQADAHLGKPASGEEILTTIESVMSKQ